jgi:ArsR family transcriptional regulator, arsenate/arsenite/antimonite-responsive transcriptional repressor
MNVDIENVGTRIDICQYGIVKRKLDLIEDPDCCAPALAPAVGEQEAVNLARAFAALADPARLRLFTLIASQPGQVCACSLVEPVGRSQPTVSHHLKVLYEAGLVDKERRGSWIWYWAVPGRVEGLVEALGAASRAPAEV